MTGDPPFAFVGGGDHIIVIEVAALIDSTSTTFKGASGTVRIVAPFPTADSSDKP